MRTGGVVLLCLLCGGVTLASQTVAAATSDSSRQGLRRAAWDGVAGLERLELQISSNDSITPARGARIARARDDLRRTLDTLVFETDWGPAELEQLRLAWPGSVLLDQYAAALAERRGDAATALALVTPMLRRDPTDVEIQRLDARLLERVGRVAESIDAYTRALDLVPEDDSTFRALQRLREANGTLAELLAQIQRLRIRLPASAALAEHETEVMERLGRRPGGQ